MSTESTRHSASQTRKGHVATHDLEDKNISDSQMLLRKSLQVRALMKYECKSFSFDSHLSARNASSASDLASRRSVFSRKHYGSVEMLSNTDSEGFFNNAGRFRLETGCSERDLDQAVRALSTPIHLENPESQTRWYFKFFLGKVHQVYAGTDVDKEPFVLAVVVTDAANHGVNQYRAVLWRKMGSQKLCLPFHANNPLTVKKILNSFDLHRFERHPKEIFNPEIQKDVLTLEEQEGSVNFKFGVLYAKEGQLSDEEMYNNEHGSVEFETFVDLLGERVHLKDWDKFKGGLDTKNTTTGAQSVYTVYEGHEIMFHVSTMLPYSAENRQQVERKRHVGNDIVNIIFVDKCHPSQQCSWRPAMMKTHFTHIFALVTYDAFTDAYRLNISAEESVPLFGPPLPSPPEFFDKQQFRDFLLVKLINGEKAAFDSPVFAQKRQRTLDMLLRNILENYTNDTKISVLHIRSFGDIVADQYNNSFTRKDESRGFEFVRIGQSLKLKTILRGDAPTSLITSSMSKREPWKPHLYCADLLHKVICGDTWGEKMVASTDEGTFLLAESVPVQLVIDRSIPVKQISIVEALGIMILCTDKGRESRVCVFQLSDLDGSQDEIPFNKGTIKDQKIEKTKGCHLFSLSKSYMNPLRMVVAVGRKLQLFSWKLLSTYSSLSCWNQFTGNEMASGFQFIRELPTFEPIQIMTLMDGCRGANRICVGYRNQFDLIDERTGDTIRLFKHDSIKAQVVDAIDVCADDEAELLLCFNRTCHFQKLAKERSFATVSTANSISNAANIGNTNSEQGEICLTNGAATVCTSSPAPSYFSFSSGVSCSSDFDFRWNFEPRDIVIAFPYVLAFAENAIEIRLIINGNLVHTMNVPDCRLITSKFDIYFLASVATLTQEVSERMKEASPHVRGNLNHIVSQSEGTNHEETNSSRDKYYCVYRIPLSCLTGGHVAPSGCATNGELLSSPCSEQVLHYSKMLHTSLSITEHSTVEKGRNSSVNHSV